MKAHLTEITDNLCFEKHLEVTLEQTTAIDLLAQNTPELSRQQLKYAMQSGAVWLTQNRKTTRLRRAKKSLQFGQTLHLYYNQQLLDAEITPAILVANEDSYSVWNKPSGMFSQGSKWSDRSAVCRWVEQVGLPGVQAFQVHRLDRATNGLILVAHGKKMTALLTQLFETRQIVKRYQCLVAGQFPVEKQHTTIELPVDDKSAVTRIVQVEYLAEHQVSRVVLEIETGRKHQIRKHLAGVGFAIIGDRLYGDAESLSQLNSSVQCQLADLQLQAFYLKFQCPVDGSQKEYHLPSSLIF